MTTIHRRTKFLISVPSSSGIGLKLGASQQAPIAWGMHFSPLLIGDRSEARWSVYRVGRKHKDFSPLLIGDRSEAHRRKLHQSVHRKISVPSSSGIGLKRPDSPSGGRTGGNFSPLLIGDRSEAFKCWIRARDVWTISVPSSSGIGLKPHRVAPFRKVIWNISVPSSSGIGLKPAVIASKNRGFVRLMPALFFATAKFASKRPPFAKITKCPRSNCGIRTPYIAPEPGSGRACFPAE